jgi:hypothetical protein
MVDQSEQLCVDQPIELCNLIITVDQQLEDNNKSSSR